MNKYKYSILALLVSLLVTSCSTTKYVPDGSYLLSKVTIRVDSLSTYEQEQLGELDLYLTQSPWSRQVDTGRVQPKQPEEQ